MIAWHVCDSVMVGFLFGLWLISAANDCRAEDPLDQDGDCDLDFELQTFAKTLKYLFQIFIGMGDMGGVVGQGIAQVFMVGVIVFG